jgi:hypothetical protein
MVKDNHSRKPDHTSHGEGPFYSALESGLRALCVLYEAFPQSFDTQRLVFFDYLVVHSGDVEDGPKSLHPATPFRSNEWVVRRHLVDRGLRLLVERGLVMPQLTDAGIFFVASETAGAFVACLVEPYTKELKKRARWVVKSFGQTEEGELIDFFNRNLDRWGAEFEQLGDWEAEL